MPSIDARAAAFAARHFGLLTGKEVRRLGFTRAQVRQRLRSGRWLRVARELYVIAGTPHTWEREVLAACFAGPEGAVASHTSAGALWRICDPSRVPHITVPRSASGRIASATVHHFDLDRKDMTQMGRIPVTPVPRTLIDLATMLPASALERCVDTALDSGRTTPGKILAAMARAGRKRPGMPALRTALEAWTDPIRPGSPAEARLLRRLAGWGFPTPVRQHVVCDGDGRSIGRVDVAWPACKVGLEYDSVSFHGPRRFDHDERRHAAIEALGWRLEHTDRLDLRPGDQRLLDVLRGLLGVGRGVTAGQKVRPVLRL